MPLWIYVSQRLAASDDALRAATGALTTARPHAARQAASSRAHGHRQQAFLQRLPVRAARRRELARPTRAIRLAEHASQTLPRPTQLRRLGTGFRLNQQRRQPPVPAARHQPRAGSRTVGDRKRGDQTQCRGPSRCGPAGSPRGGRQPQTKALHHPERRPGARRVRCDGSDCGFPSP